MQADQKGLSRFGIGIDDFDGAISQQIGQIAGLTDLDVVFPQILGVGRRRPVFVREIIEDTGAEAVEMVIAALQGAEIGQ